eukprot:TRINITY_DN115_c3_g1_i2.p1 TRINITY_DN115_c3_g1~~TRINITY_DN115_c3_g1_i2.p1  ORF type:complete len:1160 (+),score=268.09 TRINITY_DN115_c3_g1_i2:138-3617(+)
MTTHYNRSQRVMYKEGNIVPDKQHEKNEYIPHPHINSFNWFLEEGLPLAVKDLDVEEIRDPKDPDGSSLKLKINEVQIGYPSKATYEDRLLPSECRVSGGSYGAPFFAVVSREIDGKPTGETIQKSLGKLPIMVRSSRCRLHKLPPAELIKCREESNEMGGYFIINGIEKIVRLLIQPRRNHPMALERGAYQKRGPTYTNMGVAIRCARPDQTTQTVVLHYLTTGNCTVRFLLNKQEYFVPIIIIMKALVDTTDREIYDTVIQGHNDDTFLTDRVELILRDHKQTALNTKAETLSYLGKRFRPALPTAHQDWSDRKVGQHLITKHILVHLHSSRAKFDLLAFMLRKLYAFANGSICADSQDSPMHQELMLAGHIFNAIVKEKLQEWLASIKRSMLADMRGKNYKGEGIRDPVLFKKGVDRAFKVGDRLDYFLATGNLISSSGLDMMQVSGYTILAEKLNYYRYLAHFRCVHRGSFFAEMKTTAVRKLLPEAWGFMCPVHTPDGAPCGLLNHLSSTCHVTVKQMPVDTLLPLMCDLGMCPLTSSSSFSSSHLPVVVDGRVVGMIDVGLAPSAMKRLRHLKATNDGRVPQELELVLVLPTLRGEMAGVYMFGSPARMLRPVRYLATGDTEMIGTYEQVYLSIACMREDFQTGKTTHQELDPANILSIIASLTPFSDFNQSPRNMYQCQMGKQTMGTPFHSFPHRVDNKIYRIQTPQLPLVRTHDQDAFALDEYPIGANAIVAVISYTGYDMEDAMIINKSSYERGFGHASVYKTEMVDISDKRHNRQTKRFSLPEGGGGSQYKGIGEDGLPTPGEHIENGQPLYSYFDDSDGQHHVVKYKGKEEGFIEEVRMVGAGPNNDQPLRARIKYRMNRNPVIGDKFSSRHGQKGVLSQLWPQVDMPFSESGMVPDVIINPHAFPSRMTIGMLVESMAGKAGSLHGVYQDCTPFSFDEQNTAVDHFGKQLTAAGYSYYGNEPMYSGIYGCEFHAEIFIGTVFYQRLRHMVGDKYQVRSTGPVNKLHRQPVKGRKMGGGIRFGEMERDSLLAHGTSFLMKDRLLNCSDLSKAYVCATCGSLLSPTNTPASVGAKSSSSSSSTSQQPSFLQMFTAGGGEVAERAGSSASVRCVSCAEKADIRSVSMPYVIRYLAAELAAMNIRLSLDVK